MAFVAFPLDEAALIIGRMEKLLEDGFPDEFSGDAIAVKPRLVHGICPARGGESAPGDWLAWAMDHIAKVFDLYADGSLNVTLTSTADTARAV
jgi:hypothetical protein